MLSEPVVVISFKNEIRHAELDEVLEHDQMDALGLHFLEKNDPKML